MDKKIRLFAKSISWQAMGLCSMTCIGYFYTGSFSAGGSIAIAAALVGFVGYFVHETLWEKVRWGRNW